MSKYLRIEYIERDGNGRPRFDSYVLPVPDHQVPGEAAAQVLQFGFTQKKSRNRFPDEDQIITPGAIMSITPCDERGYSKHHLKEKQ